MTQALIKINGSDGSNDNLPIATLVSLDNDGNGGEITYLWLIVDQPSGTADALSSTTIHNPSFTPNKEGTYLLQLVVNQGLPDQATATAIVGIRDLKTFQRLPAARETIEDSGTVGWKSAANSALQIALNARADSNLIVCWSHGGAVLNQVIRFAGTHTLKSGLPGQEIVALTAPVGTSAPVGLIVGPCTPGGPVSNALVFVRVIGLFENSLSGDPNIGDPVYANTSTSLPVLSGSAVEIGRVVLHDAANHLYRFAIFVPPVIQPLPSPTSPSFNIGVDGPLNFDGVATVLGLAPTTVGAFKVYTLTRDIFALSIIIADHVKIFEANSRIFCQGAITGSDPLTSFIHNNGNDGIDGITNVSTPFAQVTPTQFYQATLGSNTGSVGNVTTGLPNPFATSGAGAAGGAGTPGVAVNGANGAPMCGGGGGNASQAGSGNAGVNGGSYTALTVDQGYDFVQQMTGRVVNGARYQFGSSGGNGTTNAVSGNNPAFGSGGASGGCCFVAARSISNLTISANGGRGGNGAGSSGSGCGSGGGGGGGGIALVHYGSKTNTTITADGGLGGAPGITGSGVFAGNGGNGGHGYVLAYNLSGDGT